MDAGILRIERALAVAQPGDKSAAGILAQDVAVGAPGLAETRTRRRSPAPCSPSRRSGGRPRGSRSANSPRRVADHQRRPVVGLARRMIGLAVAAWTPRADAARGETTGSPVVVAPVVVVLAIDAAGAIGWRSPRGVIVVAGRTVAVVGMIGVVRRARAGARDTAAASAVNADKTTRKRRPPRAAAWHDPLSHAAPRPIRECPQFANPSTQSVTKVWPIRDMAWPDCGGFAAPQLKAAARAPTPRTADWRSPLPTCRKRNGCAVDGRHAAAGGREDRVPGRGIPLARLAEPRIKVGLAPGDQAELQRRARLALFRDRQPLQERLRALGRVRAAGEGDERLGVGRARRAAA